MRAPYAIVLVAALASACGDSSAPGNPDAATRSADAASAEPADAAVPVSCQSFFDCPANAPSCVDGTCVAGVSCDQDDTAESGAGASNDGPAGASALQVPTAGNAVTIAGKICSLDGEYDFYRIDVAADASYTLRATTSTPLQYGFATPWGEVTGQGGVVHPADPTAPAVAHLPRTAAGSYLIYVIGLGDAASAAASDYGLVLEVADCGDALQCGAQAPSCNRGTCVSYDECVGDDPGEPANDGPGGATDITPAAGASRTTSGSICDQPWDERDWYRVSTDAGDGLVASLAWSGNANLDLVITDGDEYWDWADPDNASYGFSLKRNPEIVTLTYLPAGDYFVGVGRAMLDFEAAPSTAVTPYTLTVTRTESNGCASVADCDDEYVTQWFRGDCRTDGACHFLEGKGALPGGATCDSENDCASGYCLNDEFGASAAERWFCTELGCAGDDAVCEDLHAGAICFTDPEEPAVSGCLVPCSTDLECGWFGPGTPPDDGLPWGYRVCNQTTGLCEAPPLSRSTGSSATPPALMSLPALERSPRAFR